MFLKVPTPVNYFIFSYFLFSYHILHYTILPNLIWSDMIWSYRILFLHILSYLSIILSSFRLSIWLLSTTLSFTLSLSNQYSISLTHNSLSHCHPFRVKNFINTHLLLNRGIYNRNFDRISWKWSLVIKMNQRRSEKKSECKYQFHIKRNLKFSFSCPFIFHLISFITFSSYLLHHIRFLLRVAEQLD